jgi:hypothetical protein
MFKLLGLLLAFTVVVSRDFDVSCLDVLSH